MIIPIRCFTCGKIMADKIDYYNTKKLELEKKEKKDDDNLKHFNDFETKEILDDLGLIRYCCRRNLITNVDIMAII